MKKNALVIAETLANTVTPALEAVLSTDEHAGKGGSYLFDPETGTRSLQSESTPPIEEE